jgi:hypothetical protein
MKWLIMAFGVLCAGQAFADAGADVLFERGLYKEALAAYRQQTDASTGEYVRMGVCAYELDAHADALEYWLRARSHLYGMAYIRIALRCAALQSLPQTPFFFITTAVESVPPLLWQLLWLVLLFVLVVWARSWRRAAVGVFVVVLVGVTMLAWWSVQIRTQPYVLCKSATSLYAGPDKRYGTIGTMPALSVAPLEKRASLPGGASYAFVRNGALRGWVNSLEISTF